MLKKEAFLRKNVGGRSYWRKKLLEGENCLKKEAVLREKLFERYEGRGREERQAMNEMKV